MRLGGTLRHILYHLARRKRDRLVILTERPRPSEDPPIFIMGAARSGTSLLRRILDSHSRIACPPESHFIRPLLTMLRDAPSVEGLESMGFPSDLVVARLREFVDRFFLEYAQANGKARWADKTPLYVDYLDDIDRLYDRRARYIMLYRHGLDVASSLTTAIPGFVALLPNLSSVPEPRDPVRVAAAYWRDQVLKMLRFEAAHPERSFQMRYEVLVRQPREILVRMFQFLGEPFEEQVLAFNAQHHDAGREDGRAVVSRSFEPSIGTYQKWDVARQAAAAAEAHPALAMLGYAP